jgi:hypothetical protein
MLKHMKSLIIQLLNFSHYNIKLGENNGMLFRKTQRV